ncbi:MAG: hypothetical protein WCB99_07855 [Candidatus Cybelea sp.]
MTTKQRQDDRRESNSAEKVVVIGGLTPWDILTYLGQTYERLKYIRATLYQMRFDLLAVPEPQAAVLSDILLLALPMTVFTAIEALDVLSKLDMTLAPRTQLYQKLIRKWEPFRDDSAHFARRAFLVIPGRHELKTLRDGKLCGGVAGFAYDFSSDQFCAGTVDGQRVSVIDALDAIRAIYKDTERRLLREPTKYPQESLMDLDIDRTISFYDEHLDEDIDSLTEFDYLFDERFERRAKAILRVLEEGPRSEEDIVRAIRHAPRSITVRVLRLMGRDKMVNVTRTENGWQFERSSFKASAKNLRR